jgi:hypothetical protein
MSNPCEPRPCALHVLVPGGDVVRPDPSALVDALGDRLGALIVRAVPDGDGDVALSTLRLAADVIDDLTRRTGRTVRYQEHTGDIGDTLRRDAEAGVRSVVVLPAGSPRRTVRAVRRAVVDAGGHLAVVPAASPAAGDLGDRR